MTVRLSGRFRDASPFCIHAPCGTFLSTKLQPGNGFDVVFRSGPVGEVPPRRFGTSVAFARTNWTRRTRPTATRRWHMNSHTDRRNQPGPFLPPHD